MESCEQNQITFNFTINIITFLGDPCMECQKKLGHVIMASSPLVQEFFCLEMIINQCNFVDFRQNYKYIIDMKYTIIKY